MIVGTVARNVVQHVVTLPQIVLTKKTMAKEVTVEEGEDIVMVAEAEDMAEITKEEEMALEVFRTSVQSRGNPY
eukprot:710932-Ditylum_brightwellii.AAC.1